MSAPGTKRLRLEHFGIHDKLRTPTVHEIHNCLRRGQTDALAGLARKGGLMRSEQQVRSAPQRVIARQRLDQKRVQRCARNPAFLQRTRAVSSTSAPRAVLMR